MSQRLKKTLLWTTLIAIASFTTSFASQIVTSYYFGTRSELDAYWIAFSLMGFFAFPLTPFRDALIPEFHRIKKNRGKEADAYFSQVFTLILLVGALGAVSCFVWADRWVALAIDAEDINIKWRALELLHLLSPVVVLLAISETLNAMMSSYHKVVMQSLSRLLGAGSGLAALLLSSSILSSKALPLSIMAAQATMIAVQAASLRRQGLEFKFSWPTRLGKVFISSTTFLLVTYAASQAYGVFEKHVLVNFSHGLVSSFQYSVSLTNVIITLGGVTLSNVLSPRFLDHAANNALQDMYADMSKAVRLLILIMGSLCTFAWINSAPLVELIYARGAFGPSAVRQTSEILRITIFAAIPISIGLLMVRALIALNAAKTVMKIGLITTISGVGILLAAATFEAPQLAFAHWLLANLAGVLAYILALNRLCGMPHQQLIVDLPWLFKVIVNMCIAVLLTNLMPFYGTDSAGLLAAICVRGLIFFATFFVFSLITKVLEGLPFIPKLRVIR